MLAAAALAAAVPAGLAALAPRGPELERIVVASHDLPGGQVISSGDVRAITMAKADLPDGSTSDPDALVGRAVTGPVRRGEPLTDARIVGPGLLRGLADRVASTVRLADPADADLVRPGDLVDVLAADSSSVGSSAIATPQPPAQTAPGTTGSAGSARLARVVASGARVLAVSAPRTTDGAAFLSAARSDSAVLVVAVPPDSARALAYAAAGLRLSVVVRSGSPKA